MNDPEGLWGWLLSPVLIFLWAGVEMLAYTFPFWSWLIIAVILWKFYRLAKANWSKWR